MDGNLLKEEIQEFQMPLSMQERILKNCQNAGMEEKENVFMAKNISVDENKENTSKRTGRKWTRIATVAAAVTLCLGLGGITIMATSDKLEGIFTDVTRWDGAIIGSTYEQATEEIEVSATVSGNSLVVDVALLKANEAPYVIFEKYGIQAYQIQDKEGNIIVEGSTFEKADIIDDKVSMTLPLDELENGSYTLIISEFAGSAKAEQDLPLKGYWECEFEIF